MLFAHRLKGLLLEALLLVKITLLGGFCLEVLVLLLESIGLELWLHTRLLRDLRMKVMVSLLERLVLKIWMQLLLLLLLLKTLGLDV